MLKYKLVTLPKGTARIPVVRVAQTTIELNSNESTIIKPQTVNFGGGNRRKHNAHLSITNMILRTSNLNQYDASKEAKLHLDNLTVAPFMRLEKELKGKYTESQGGGAASIGAGSIDVLTTQIDGVTLKTHIFNQIEALPKNRFGKPDSAILARFIQNIPDNFMIGNEPFKTQIENAFKTEEIAFKLS